MYNVLGYLNFNCVPTFVNLILILIFNAGSISFDICQLTIFKNLKNFSGKVPIVSTLNIAFQSFSFAMGILIFFFKNCKELKVINKIIVISGKLLKLLSIILALIDIVLLIDEFSHLDEKYFINEDIKFGNNLNNCSVYERFNKIKEIQNLPFIINEEKNSFIIEDPKKFKIVDTSRVERSFKDISGFDNDSYDDEFQDRIFSLSFMILDEILIVLSGLNWGSVEKKIGKLIDSGIESRIEDTDEKPSFCTNFFSLLAGICSLIVIIGFFVVEIILFIVITSVKKLNWANNFIIGTCMSFNLGSCVASVLLGFPMYKSNTSLNCCSIILLMILFIIYIADFYTIILSFYVIYYSYFGKTFFYYYCCNTDLSCNGLFEIHSTDIFNIDIDNEFNCVYYKIFISPTNNSFFIFLIITRIIFLIGHLFRIGSCIMYIRNSGSLEKMKKIIDFIKNEDGTFIDFDKIKIEEIVETTKQIKNGKEIEKKVTKLVRKIMPYDNYGNQANNNPDFNNANIHNINHIQFTDGNNLNSNNRMMTLNFAKK